jgi:outer membrane protein TolC
MRSKIGLSGLCLLLLQSQLILGSTLTIKNEKELTLPAFQELLQTALSGSLESKRAAVIRDQAINAREGLSYDRYPQFGTSVTWRDRSPKITNPEIKRDPSYAAYITYDLYDFERSSSRLAEADLNTKVKLLSIDEVNEALTWQISRSYLGAVSSARLLAISKENMGVSEARLSATKAGYGEGLRPEMDLVAAESDFGETKLTYLRAEAELMKQVHQMALVAGVTVPEGTAFKIEARDNTPADWDLLVKGWQETAPSAANARRLAERELLLASEVASQTAARPKLGLRLGADQNGNWPKDSIFYSAQIQLSWDLMWPGQYRSEREQWELKRNVLGLEDEIEMRDRSHSLALANRRFQSTKELFELTENQFKLRKRQHDLALARYKAGKATSFELSTVELELGKVRLERARLGNSLAEAALEIGQARRIKDPEAIFSIIAKTSVK